MSKEREREIALREAASVAAEDAYFLHRPVADFAHARVAFGAGFDRGWKAATDELDRLRVENEAMRHFSNEAIECAIDKWFDDELKDASFRYRMRAALKCAVETTPREHEQALQLLADQAQELNMGYRKLPIRQKTIPCGECHLQPGETCDVCGAKQEQGE